jgi:MFS family permease
VSSPASTQPEALAGRGLRNVVAVLSVTQITSWGVLYYAFAALSPSITSDTGWSSVAVAGAFSVGQLVSAGVGIWVGRHIDAYGPRRVMTAGSLVAVPGVLAVAVAPNLLVFYAGWVVAGIAMAGVLYPPAFAALTHWGGERRVSALTTLTLVGGLASTVFAPLSSWLDDGLGWRGAYLTLLAGLVLITVPLHWWGLRPRWTRRVDASDGPVDAAAAYAGARGVARSRPFVLLTIAMALTSLSVFAVVVNLVPMLIEQGMSRNLAAVALGLGGVGQFAGRLGYAAFAARTSERTRAVLVVLGVAVATAALAVSPALPVLLIALGMLVGLTRGIYTLIQATAITDRWGPSAYGTLNGLLMAPSLVASASAPFAGAALAHLVGSYAHAFLVLAGVAGLAAVLLLWSSPGQPRPAR